MPRLLIPRLLNPNPNPSPSPSPSGNPTPTPTPRPPSLLFPQHRQRVAPLLGLHAVKRPRDAQRLEVAGPFDSTEIDDFGPAEIMQDRGDLALRVRVVSADEHIRR